MALVLVLLHNPPATLSVNIIDEVTHTLDAPVMLLVFGAGFTIMACIAVAGPHELVTVYLIVSNPPETPVTIPPITVALALLLLQVPPVTLSVNVMDDPTHTPEGPDIIPSSGSGFTVMGFVAVAVPQPLITV